MRLAAEPTASTPAKVPANPSPGPSPSSSRSRSVHPSPAAATSTAAGPTDGEDLRALLYRAAGFGVGDWVVSKAAPAIQARIEALVLDAVWEIWAPEGWM